MYAPNSKRSNPTGRRRCASLIATASLPARSSSRSTRSSVAGGFSGLGPRATTGTPAPRKLLDAALAQLPAGVTQAEVSALLENTRLQELAERAAGNVRTNIMRSLSPKRSSMGGPIRVAFASRHRRPARDRAVARVLVPQHAHSGRAVVRQDDRARRARQRRHHRLRRGASATRRRGLHRLPRSRPDTARSRHRKKLVMALAKPLLDLSPAGVVALTVDGENTSAMRAVRVDRIRNRQFVRRVPQLLTADAREARRRGRGLR